MKTRSSVDHDALSDEAARMAGIIADGSHVHTGGKDWVETFLWEWRYEYMLMTRREIPYNLRINSYRWSRCNG